MDTAQARILIADDELTMLSLMSSILEDSGRFVVTRARDGEEALARIGQEAPDLLITDLRMPRMGGETLTSRALALRPDLTILVTTGNGTIDGAVSLMKQGVCDFITKPFAVDDFLDRVQRAVEKVRMEPLSPASQAMVTSLLIALERKDPYIKNHSSRVAAHAGQLSRDLGFGQRESLLIERAGLVHDLGKIGVSERILNKEGPLDAGELEQIKKHPIYSADIIGPLKELRECLRDVYHHHERIDGKGYPDGLVGEAIPIGARVIAVCDAYDAMASARSYRGALPPDEVRRRLIAARGTQLEGDFVDTFLKRLTEQEHE
jgi:putative two-component system response regulator